jgi:hypothetical protein
MLPVVAQAQATASDQPVTQYTFGNNSVMLLNVDPWGSLGFGAVNPGDASCFTQNKDLWNLADEIGLCQLLATMDPGARGWEPPNAALAKRIASMYNRCKTLLNGKMILEGDADQTNGMTSKQDQSARPFLIHPCPFFKGPMMRNKWIDECNQVVMTLLSNLYQHPCNRFGAGITVQCVRDLTPFLNQLALIIGVELCGLSQATVLDEKFLFDLGPTGQFTIANYTPTQLVINQNAIWNQGAVLNVPTLEDLGPMVPGIPANDLLPLLAQYPKGPVPQAAGMQGNPMLTRDAVLGYSSTQPNAMPTARDTLVNAINSVIQQANAPGGAAPPSSAGASAPSTDAASNLRPVPTGAA